MVTQGASWRVHITCELIREPMKYHNVRDGLSISRLNRFIMDTHKNYRGVRKIDVDDKTNQ